MLGPHFGNEDVALCRKYLRGELMQRRFRSRSAFLCFVVLKVMRSEPAAVRNEARLACRANAVAGQPPRNFRNMDDTAGGVLPESQPDVAGRIRVIVLGANAPDY